jgi:DNA-binding HxlR family transcriptional regulator
VTPDDGDGLAAALELVGQRWALLVVRSLLDGAKRYGDLQRELGAPTNILATRLRELQAAGILYRVPLAHNVRAYALTERGAALGRPSTPWRGGARQRSGNTRQVGSGKLTPPDHRACRVCVLWLSWAGRNPDLNYCAAWSRIDGNGAAMALGDYATGDVQA